MLDLYCKLNGIQLVSLEDKIANIMARCHARVVYVSYAGIFQAKIPISEVLLEDLILALDTDLNDELDYRELAKGMGLWKVEKRESKRKMLASNITSASMYYI